MCTSARRRPAHRPSCSLADCGSRELYLKHHSAVGLVDRLVQQGLMTREGSRAYRHKVELALTPHGRDVLATLAGMHRRELKRLGPILKRFFTEISG